MSKSIYVDHKEVTREVLDQIQVGDLIKVNELKKPRRVIGVSENYFVTIEHQFKDTYYSVCEKKPATHSRNQYTEGSFRIGGDDWVCGCPDGYHWDKPEWVTSYLNEFETGLTELSVRSAIDLRSISIKSCQPKDKSEGEFDGH